MNNLNEKTIEILKEKADYYKKLSKICEESLKSNNITAACKKEEFPVREFRNRVLDNTKSKVKTISKEYYETIKKDIMSPEEKIYRAIFLVPDDEDFDLPNIPDEELEQTVEFVINSLEYRDRDIIVGRFFNNKTLKELSEEFGITQSRVAQLENKALRRLRHPKRARILVLGKNKSDIRDKRINEMQNQLNEYETRIDEIKNELKLKKEELERIDRTVYHQDIEVLNLSVRAYNYLKRYGINKISDIKANEGELVKIRGLTRKLIDEISQKMEGVGIPINEEF